nr:hypothetical protein BaRGS_016720 [Batillaria attramentaria]
MSSVEGAPTSPNDQFSGTNTATSGRRFSGQAQDAVESQSQPFKPTAPGKPRRLSRQTSADTKRQQFAGTKLAGSGEGRHLNTTSADSGCDDVFVEFHSGEYDVISGRPVQDPTQAKRTGEPIFSTSSTASILPNPYNRFNHRLHSMIWCCSCIYFVFFCCLPAIHYMEQSDVEFTKGNYKRARALARASTFLFCTGTLIMLSMFALIFFLAIFFTVYY